MYLGSSLLVLAVLLISSQAVPVSPVLNPGEIGIVEVCTASSDDSAQDIADRIRDRLVKEDERDHSWLVYVTEENNGWWSWMHGLYWTHQNKCGYDVHIIRDNNDGCADNLKTRAKQVIQDQADRASGAKDLRQRLKTKPSMKNSDFIVEQKKGTSSATSFYRHDDCRINDYFGHGFYVAALLIN